MLSPHQGLSGNVVPDPLTSTGGAMLLAFLSDFSVRGRGITFAWTSSDGESLPSHTCAFKCPDSKRGNGICDDACFNEQCSWDAGDCDLMCNVTSGCMAVEQGDGTCDTRCLNAGCHFDAADCACKTAFHEPCACRD